MTGKTPNEAGDALVEDARAPRCVQLRERCQQCRLNRRGADRPVREGGLARFHGLRRLAGKGNPELQ